jgi:16S rRNA (adenine1518-N6/adenine1519-N6)-dimethyltransferase
MEHRARKRFGQNFLNDPHVVARIVDAVNPQAGDHIVEIGPGLGALTEALLTRIPEMDAVELDRDIIPKLAARCGALGTLNIHTSDALRFDFASLVEDGRPLRVVGNLPYNISTPLLFHLLDSRAHIQDMHFMLQKEVVNRLAAQPHSKDYGRLSVMVQYHCQVTALFEVPPHAFTPPPKVTSAVVRLVPYAEPPNPINDVDVLEAVVTQAFAQRRKTLRNTLKKVIPAKAMEQAGIDPVRRAETLSLEEFVTLARLVDKKQEQ